MKQAKYGEWHQEYERNSGQPNHCRIVLDASFRIPVYNCLFLTAHGNRVVFGKSEPGSVALCLDPDGIEWLANQCLDWLRRNKEAQMEWQQKEEEMRNETDH